MLFALCNDYLFPLDCDSRDNRRLSNGFNQLRHTRFLFDAFTCEKSSLNDEREKNFSIEIWKLIFHQIFTWTREKFRHSRDARQNIYLSELTNEYWSMKHERTKISLKFSFSAASGGVAQTISLRLYWFARRLFTFRAAFFLHKAFLTCFLLRTQSIE